MISEQFQTSCTQTQCLDIVKLGQLTLQVSLSWLFGQDTARNLHQGSVHYKSAMQTTIGLQFHSILGTAQTT